MFSESIGLALVGGGITALAFFVVARALHLGADTPIEKPTEKTTELKGFELTPSLLAMTTIGITVLGLAVLVSDQNQHMRGLQNGISGLQQEYAALRQVSENVQREREALLTQINESLRQSIKQTGTLPAKLDTQLASRLQFTKEELESLRTRISQIQASQLKVLEGQGNATNTLGQLSRSVATQSKDFEAIRAKLKTFEIQNEVAEIVAEASPAEFAPTIGWEFVEQATTKGEPRKFVLAKTSPLVQSKSVSLTWKVADPEKETVVFEGTVIDRKIIDRMGTLCSQRGLNCLLGDVRVGILPRR